MQVIRSYWDDNNSTDVWNQIPETPLYNDVIYAFGEKNEERLQELRDRGYDVRHILQDLYNEQGNMYGRKLVALTLGLTDFEEVLMLDWDCVPVKPIDDKFMEYMAEKPVQVPLYMQPNQNPYDCSYEFNGAYAQPNFGFVYSRDRDLGRQLLEHAVFYGLEGMIEEWAMYIYAVPTDIENYIGMYHPKVCFGVDKDFYTANPEAEHSMLQLPLITKVEQSLPMNIYFRHE